MSNLRKQRETDQLLGVTIDSKLNFNNHISIICKKKNKSKDWCAYKTPQLDSD